MNEFKKFEREVEGEVKSVAQRVDEFFETKFAHTIILSFVLLSGVIAGLGTFPDFFAKHGFGIQVMENLIIWTFTLELTARIIMTGKRFFRNYWNVFDLIVIMASVIPFWPELTVLRLLRILHSINLLDLLPKTRHVIDGFMRSLPGIFHVIFLEFVFIYTFSIMAYHLYGQLMPEKFGHVGLAMYTLFNMLGNLDWGVLANEMSHVAPHAWIFTLVFALVGGYVLLNFVVAAVVDAMNEAAHKDQKEKKTHYLEARFDHLVEEIQTLRALLEKEVQKKK